MFQGHKFIKLINDHWVLDITEYIGYKVTTNSIGECINYKKAFKVTSNNKEITIDKFIKIPVKILKEAKRVVIGYESEIPL